MASLRNDRWNLVWVSLFSLIVAVGVFVRYWQIDRRPMHHDEACQAVRFGQLLESGKYTYDPNDHHGPSLYYAAIPIARLAGCNSLKSLTERVVRFLPAFAGALSVLLIASLVGGLGRPATLAAAGFAAVSTSLVYYSNYFIQESMLVLFTAIAIITAWRYMQSGLLRWALVAGLFAGLMHATKETCIFAYVCGACALIDAAYTGRLTGIHDAVPKGRILRGLVVMALSASVISVVLFSSVFSNWGGVWDSIRTYWLYIERSSGANVHDKPFYYYFQLLALGKGDSGTWWSEAGMLLLAGIGICSVIKGSLSGGKSTRLEIFIVSFSVLILLAYSVVSYKTPWCVMSISFSFCLVAGIGFGRIRNMLTDKVQRILFYCATCIIFLQTGTQSLLATSIYCADTRSPYVYSQTVPDFLKLVKRINTIAALSSRGDNSLMFVVALEQDTWPLPWYTRQYSKAGYWTDPAQVPLGVKPDMWVVSPEFDGKLAGRIGDDYQQEFYGLRPDVFLSLYIRKDLWNEFMKTVAGDKK